MTMYTTTNTIREWPVGLLDAVFEAEPGIEKGLPGDFDGSLDYVLSLIPRDRDREILVERYRDRLTMDAISQRHGITRERVRQIIACCLHMMRRPTVRRFLQYGVSGVLAREAQAAAKTARERAQASLEKHLTAQYGKTQAESIVRHSDAMLTPVSGMNLSNRSRHCLYQCGCETAGDIVRMTPQELMAVRNLGQKSYREIVNRLEALGINADKFVAEV